MNGWAIVMVSLCDGQTPGTIYMIQAQAIGGTGQSGWSNPVSKHIQVNQFLPTVFVGLFCFMLVGFFNC